MRRDVITISVRLSDEEQVLLNKLINKYGRESALRYVSIEDSTSFPTKQF